MEGSFKRWSDENLENEIVRVQNAIQVWAESHELWFDCCFKPYIEHVNGEPDVPPIVTLLIAEGGLNRVLVEGDDLEIEFRSLLNKLGYWYENLNGVTFAIYAEDNGAAAKFAEYFHWQWVCSLIKEDTSDIYEELYSHFARRPDDLHRIHWRDFEILLSRIFQNQGFEVELGSGRNDEGVDLWMRDPIGDILTVVQAKRYSNKIDQTQVAALYGVSEIERADKALFVTTSSYLPVAHRFAARTSGKLELAEKNDIVRWCEQATAGIIADKSSLISAPSVNRIISEVANKLDARVLYTNSGSSMTINNFALVIKETKHAALLMSLEGKTVSDDVFGQRGYEVPRLDGSTVSRLSSELVWRAKRKVYGNRVGYWDGGKLYYAWDGQPAYFDYCD